MTEPIVVGTDGSQGGNRAVAWAAAEASRRRCRLRIVHAMEPWPRGTRLLEPARTIEHAERAASEILAAAQRSVQDRWPELEVTTALVSQHAAGALHEESREAAELVVGGRGRGGFAGLALGSTSLHTASHSTVPVVVVRGRPSPDGPVVVGIDLGRGTDAALEYAFQAAAVRAARLRVLHAWYFPLPGAAVPIDDDQVTAELYAEVARACAPWRERYRDVAVDIVVVVGHPVVALADASAGARLLVMGAHKRDLSAVWLGSVTHGVIHWGECPVAIVPST